LDDSIDQLRKTTLDFCQSSRLLCIDLTPALKERANQREILYFPVNNHWNKPGNRVVAEEIYRFLVAKNILSDASVADDPASHSVARPSTLKRHTSLDGVKH
jgi:hypothetical protein